MKKMMFAAMVLGLSTLAISSRAQDEVKKEKEKKESQEIIIRKKGDKDSKLTVEINGDKVTINGKPLSEFKDDDITINKKNIIIRGGKGQDFNFNFSPDEFTKGMTWSSDDGEKHAFLGVTTDKVDDGAKITDLSKDGAAEKAGLKEGDVITKVGATTITGPESLSAAIMALKPKDEAKITYKRDGKESTATATLGTRKSMAYTFSSGGDARAFSMPKMEIMPDINFNSDNWAQAGGSGNAFFSRRQKLGLKIQDTEDGNGVKVLAVEEGSAAATAGLKADDIVTEIGGKKVMNTDEAREQLQDNAEKQNYSIKAKRNGSQMNFDIKIPKKLKTANL